MPSSEVQSISTRGSIWRREGAILYSFAFFISVSKISSRFSPVFGIPVSSHKSAAHSHSVSAITGKTTSTLSPSMETELIRPGLLQKSTAFAQMPASGLSMAMGVSTTFWTRSISHFIVSSSTETSVDAQTSINAAPASAWVFARFFMKSESFSAIAWATEGIEPLIFSPMIIMLHLSSVYVVFKFLT